MDDKTRKIVEKAQTKDTLKQMFERTLGERIERHLEVKPHGIIPNSHFATVSAECYSLYQDGHYYGTISLSQAVAEALVKFLIDRNNLKKGKDYKTNVQRLKKDGVIDSTLEIAFNDIWKERNNFHHLNPQIEQDRQKLASLAKEKLTDLRDIEKELFAYTTNNGKLVPKYRKYWDQTGNTISVFLRLD